MTTKFHYQTTALVKKNLEQLYIFKELIELIPHLPHIEENLRRESLLKSSLYSARIEGNPHQLEDLQYLSTEGQSKDVSKLEITNLYKGMHWVYTNQAPQKINTSVILKLHGFVMEKISPSAGHFRHEPSAIFNQAGVAVYLTPPPSQIPKLIEELTLGLQPSQESGPIISALTHFKFEKIHPFLDGNGRTGRLLSALILKNSGFGFRGLVSLEEYLEQNRQTYYDLLLYRGRDLTSFVEFFLSGLAIQTQKTLDKIKLTRVETEADLLLPRRREILEIIKNHRLVSFDFIKRRFKKVPESTLHYDLTQLLKSRFIKKLGKSRGVLYCPTSSY